MFIPFGGWIADRLGAKKRAYVAGIAVLLVGSILWALQTDLLGLFCAHHLGSLRCAVGAGRRA